MPDELPRPSLQKPLVSIGVPVYNGERLLRRTLESLVGQTYRELEILVCDNASTDGTARIAREFAARDPRVRYLRNATNIGAIPNFLRTLALAGGRYFTWTAADDVRPPRAIEACVAALEAMPEAVMAHGPIELELPPQQNPVRVIANRADLVQSSASARVEAFTAGVDHVGMMFGLHRRAILADTPYGLHVGGDYVVCLQLCQRGHVAWVSTAMLTYRHQYGALDNPMYAREPITVRDLLLHRGVRRKKCWSVLGIGARRLWQRGDRDRTGERVRTVAAFVRAFTRRFRSHLATEAVFLLFTPASWIATPLASVARRLRRNRRVPAAVPSR